MSSTEAIIIFLLWVAFAIYRIRIYFLKKNSKSNRKVEIKESNLDRRFYSTLSFDFPNIQSKVDMKFIDFSSNLAKQHTELEVAQYCKY